MTDSTLHMLAKMGSSFKTVSQFSNHLDSNEELEKPELVPSLNLGKELSEMLAPSFSKQHTPLE